MSWTAMGSINSVIDTAVNEYLPTQAMLTTVYDSTANGIVDDSEKLNNQSASYYLSWNNFTDTPTTVSGYGITDAAPLGSPTFTGTPAAPTATTGTNTTQLATTAFVQQEIAAVTEW